MAAPTQLRIRRPDILLKRLCYCIKEIEGMKGLATKASSYKKGLIKEMMEDLIRSTEGRELLEQGEEPDNLIKYHKLFSTIPRWWMEVVLINEEERRPLALLVSLSSTTRVFSKHGSRHKFLRTIYDDPLSPRRQATIDYVNMIKSIGLSEKTLLIFLDGLYCPFPMFPERFKENVKPQDNLECIPVNLREHYREHMVYDSAYSPASAADGMRRTISDKLRKGLRLEKDEKEFLLNEKEFRKKLQYSNKINKVILKEQLVRYFSSLKPKITFVTGFDKNYDHFGLLVPTSRESLEPYKIDLPVKSEYYNPGRDKSYVQLERIIEKGISSKASTLGEFMLKVMEREGYDIG